MLIGSEHLAVISFDNQVTNHLQLTSETGLGYGEVDQ